MFAASVMAITGAFKNSWLFFATPIRFRVKAEFRLWSRQRRAGNCRKIFLWSGLTAISNDQIKQRQQKSLDSRVIHAVTIKTPIRRKYKGNRAIFTQTINNRRYCRPHLTKSAFKLWQIVSFKSSVQWPISQNSLHTCSFITYVAIREIVLSPYQSVAFISKNPLIHGDRESQPDSSHLTSYLFPPYYPRGYAAQRHQNV